MPQNKPENRGIKRHTVVLLTLVIAMLGGIFVLSSTAATPTVKPPMKPTVKANLSAPLQQTHVPVEIVKTETVTADGYTANKVTLRNVSDKSIAFLRIFVREDYRASLTVNCFLRPEGALDPYEEITINDVRPSDPFIVGVAVYTDFTTSGDSRVTKGDVEFVRGWSEAARNYKSRLKDVKERHTPENAARLLVQQVLQDRAEARKGKPETGHRRNGAQALYYYFHVMLTNSPDKRDALDALERTTGSIAMKGDPQ